MSHSAILCVVGRRRDFLSISTLHKISVFHKKYAAPLVNSILTKILFSLFWLDHVRRLPWLLLNLHDAILSMSSITVNRQKPKWSFWVKTSVAGTYYQKGKRSNIFSLGSLREWVAFVCVCVDIHIKWAVSYIAQSALGVQGDLQGEWDSFLDE